MPFTSRFALALVAGTAISVATPAIAQDMPLDITPLGDVEIRGNGEIDLILIPGVGQNWQVWSDFMDRNDDRYRMHAVTLPGFDGTQPPPEREGERIDSTPWLDNAVAAVIAYCDEMQLDNPHVLGHGMGGHLALRVAVNHPERVASGISVVGAPALPIAGNAQLLNIQNRLAIVNGQFLPALEGMQQGMWEANQQNRPKQLVTNQARAEWLGRMISREPKDTLIQYQMEFAISDITQQMAQSDEPMMIIANVRPDLDEQQRPIAFANWDMQIANALSTTLVFFEDTNFYLQFDRPIALDNAVWSFVNDEDVEGVLAGTPLPGAKRDQGDAEDENAQP